MDNLFNLNDSKSFNYYNVQQGDTLYAIAKKYKVNPKLLATLNGINTSDYIYPNQVLILPNNNYVYYITKEGDTLKLVSDSLQIEETSLVEQNPTIYLQEGQLIVNKIS